MAESIIIVTSVFIIFTILIGLLGDWVNEDHRELRRLQKCRNYKPNWMPKTWPEEIRKRGTDESIKQSMGRCQTHG